MNRVHPRQIADVLPTSVTVIERACVWERKKQGKDNRCLGLIFAYTAD
jgi:hypothetical protein